MTEDLDHASILATHAYMKNSSLPKYCTRDTGTVVGLPFHRNKPNATRGDNPVQPPAPDTSLLFYLVVSCGRRSFFVTLQTILLFVTGGLYSHRRVDSNALNTKRQFYLAALTPA